MKKESASRSAEPSFVFGVENLRELLEPRPGPCVSVYFPSHRRRIEARSDSILYRNLCREVEKMLDTDLMTETAVHREIMASLRSVDCPEFWEHGSEGVAVFVAPDLLRVYRLPLEVPSLEVVGGTFHTKPLIRYLQEGLSYHVLLLHLRGARLFEGYGDALSEIPLDGIPTSVEEATGEGDDAGGARGGPPRGDRRSRHFPDGDGSDTKAEVEKFFRDVARGLAAKGIGRTGRPLILAAHKHHQPVFARVAQLPDLHEEGIRADPAKLGEEDIRRQASEILRPLLGQRVADAKEEYAYAMSRGSGSDRLPKVARAVAAGRVKHLFVESRRRIWGLLDPMTGEVVPGETRKNAHDVDLLDELAELAISRGTDVMVLSKEEMPSRTGLAATFRF